jgi:hypothetical protein
MVRDRNSAKPRLGVVHPAELPAGGDGSDEGLLHRVLGIDQIATHGIQLRDQSPVRPVVHLPHELLVAHASPSPTAPHHDDSPAAHPVASA